jgi:hypothetical protein
VPFRQGLLDGFRNLKKWFLAFHRVSVSIILKTILQLPGTVKLIIIFFKTLFRCAVFPDSRQVQGLCGSCFSFKQTLLLRYSQQGENPSTSLANKKYVVNKYLSNEELVKSKQETQKEIRILKQKLRRTESRLMVRLNQ